MITFDDEQKAYLIVRMCEEAVRRGVKPDDFLREQGEGFVAMGKLFLDALKHTSYNDWGIGNGC